MQNVHVGLRFRQELTQVVTRWR